MVTCHETAVRRNRLRDVDQIKELSTGKLVDDGEAPRRLQERHGALEVWWG